MGKKEKKSTSIKNINTPILSDWVPKIKLQVIGLNREEINGKKKKSIYYFLQIEFANIKTLSAIRGSAVCKITFFVYVCVCRLWLNVHIKLIGGAKWSIAVFTPWRTYNSFGVPSLCCFQSPFLGSSKTDERVCVNLSRKYHALWEDKHCPRQTKAKGEQSSF